MLRRDAWGIDLAFEAATAALRAAATELPDQPVLVVTQTANHRVRKLASRLGFQEASAFEEYDAQQTLAVASVGSFRVPRPASARESAWRVSELPQADRRRQTSGRAA